MPGMHIKLHLRKVKNLSPQPNLPFFQTRVFLYMVPSKFPPFKYSHGVEKQSFPQPVPKPQLRLWLFFAQGDEEGGILHLHIELVFCGQWTSLAAVEL